MWEPTVLCIRTISFLKQLAHFKLFIMFFFPMHHKILFISQGFVTNLTFCWFYVWLCFIFTWINFMFEPAKVPKWTDTIQKIPTDTYIFNMVFLPLFVLESIFLTLLPAVVWYPVQISSLYLSWLPDEVNILVLSVEFFLLSINWLNSCPWFTSLLKVS